MGIAIKLPFLSKEKKLSDSDIPPLLRRSSFPDIDEDIDNPSPFLRDEEQEKIFSMLEADLEKGSEKKPIQEVERVKKELQEALQTNVSPNEPKQEASANASEKTSQVAESKEETIAETKPSPKSLDEKIAMLKKELGIF